MNFRKFFCKLFKRDSWLWKKCDCQRYLDYVTLSVCNESHLIANEYCPATTLVTFEKGTEVNLPCITHKKPIDPPPPPPEKTDLTEALRYNATGKVFSAFFPLSILQQKDHGGWTWDYFKSFIDKIAKEDLSNVLRFIPMGLWYPVSQVKPILLFPHVEEGGKWVLESVNQEWHTRVFDRLEYMVEKGITPQIDLVDNCSIHTMPDGPWGFHWLHQDRNKGWRGEPIGDVHPSVYTHFYEWSYVGDMWFAEKGYTDESQMTPDDHAYMMRCRRTGEYWEEYLGWLVKDLIAILGKDNFLLGHNEIDGGDGWHTWMRKNIYEPCGINCRRVITSTYDDFYSKGGIRNYYSMSMHGVWNTQEYYDRINNGTIFNPADFILSGDGDESMEWGKNPDAVRALAAIAFHQCAGMERNEQDNCPLDAMNWEGAYIMLDEFKKEI